MMAAELFNCCTNGQEPDWSQYFYLFIGFNKVDQEGEDEYVVGATDYTETRFVTVYARRVEDELAEPITDIADCWKVNAVLSELLERSKLPLI